MEIGCALYISLSKTLRILSDRGYSVLKQVQDCAYINLDKRGGKTVCDQKSFPNIANIRCLSEEKSNYCSAIRMFYTAQVRIKTMISKRSCTKQGLNISSRSTAIPAGTAKQNCGRYSQHAPNKKLQKFCRRSDATFSYRCREYLTRFVDKI